MKKILILLFTLLVVTSCNNEIKNNVVQVNKTPVNDINNSGDVDKIKTESDNNASLGNGVRYDEVKNNLEKLKGLKVDGMEFEMINSQLKSMYAGYINNQAKENNDIKLCDKLDSGELKSCKMQFILSTGDITKCSILGNTGSVNSCKNKLLKDQANSTLDEKVCDKLIDETEEKSEINSCKDSVYFTKARKKSSITFCMKISDTMTKNMCKDIVKMEKL